MPIAKATLSVTTIPAVRGRTPLDKKLGTTVWCGLTRLAEAMLAMLVTAEPTPTRVHRPLDAPVDAPTAAMAARFLLGLVAIGPQEAEAALEEVSPTLTFNVFLATVQARATHLGNRVDGAARSALAPVTRHATFQVSGVASGAWEPFRNLKTVRMARHGYRTQHRHLQAPVAATPSRRPSWANRARARPGGSLWAEA